MQSMEYYLPLPFFSHAHQTKESSLPILISIPSLLLPLQHFIPITSLLLTKRAVRVDGKTRARFFSNVDQSAMNKLFPDIETKVKTKLSDIYIQLVEKSKFNRSKLEMRVTTWSFGGSISNLQVIFVNYLYPNL